MSTVEAPGGRIFDLVTRRKLGITKEAVETSLKQRKAAGEFDGWTKENLREKLAARGQELSLGVCGDIKTANDPAWCEAQKVGAVDWEALLAFITKLIEMLMPFIIKV